MISIKPTSSQGFALLFTLVIVSVVLTISLSLIQLTLKQLALAVDGRDSELAFHAASAGLECGQYERNRQPGVYTDVAGSPAIACMGLGATPPTSTSRPAVAGGNYNIFLHQLTPTFGSSGNVCVEIETHVINAVTAPITQNVGGDVGDITCQVGGVCTAIFARGYSKPTCGGTPLPFEIMRELNAVF